MADRRVLISCRHVWGAAEEVESRLGALGIEVDMPRFDGQQLEEGDLLPIVGKYVGILAGDDHLTRPVLEAASQLEVISKWGIGIDAIDLAAADELGIKVLNTPGVFGEELADYAMGFIHMLARRQHEVNAKVKAGDWAQVRGASLAGKTLGVVGFGSSGRALAIRARAASIRVLAHETLDVQPEEGVEMVTMESLLERSDIISLHVPATPDTVHLIDADALSRIRPGAWLVNTSRGSLVDEAALVAALDSGRLGAAALDVFETEPISPDHPLLSFDNVIVGSHNGSNTAEAVERTTTRAVDNLIEGLGLE